MRLDRGSLLNNRYRIEAILGQGGMGSIYRAHDENLGVEVAVKENLFTTDEYARQFRREAAILANLRHPNLPRVTDHFVIDGHGQYLVMDYIEGEDLRERMDREGVLSDVEVTIIGVAMCEALGYLHTRQPRIVHRDIKPGNVKITPNGNVILVDFGLAKQIEGGQATTTGARAMTPGYSPPEQYGTARTDERSDIYSLGATLYVALTGFLPEDALARAMEQADLTPVRRHNPKVSRRLAAVVEKALELRPEDRFQTVEEFKKALLSSRTITGQRPPGELTLTPPPAESPEAIAASDGGSYPPMSGANKPNQFQESGQFGPPLLPTSMPLAEPGSKPLRKKRRKRRLGCWVALLLVVGLLALLTGGAYVYQPVLFNQAIQQVRPYISAVRIPPIRFLPITSWLSIAAPSPTVENTAVSTPVAGQTDSNTATPALVANPAAIGTVPPSPTPSPTATPNPTSTPTIGPTAIGGGPGMIAFASDLTGPGDTIVPQIYLISVDGNARQRVTEMKDGACQPAWSPDGKRLAFISPCASNQEIYDGSSIFIVNTDGSGLTPLTPLLTTLGGDFDPAWSPDGARIAFTSLRDTGRAQIYVYNLADNTVQIISPHIYYRDYQPSWSPDGEKIAFGSNWRGNAIWTMNADGSGVATRFSRSGDLIDFHPVWSPDGRLILFTQRSDLSSLPRLVKRSVGGEPPLESSIPEDVKPRREGSFSPDGQWIAYEGWPEGENHDIFIMTLNGLDDHRIMNDTAYDFDPAWQPNPTTP